ncbi:MFS transporter [Kitasatospora sp. SUK 42]|uniref:MFS transporter n=1 Tax=Kitasatospora sp. SUK 42 TaxID=1588882 RepID=UPI0018C96F32|nr:MFS transporter [Kitasatospora sp. SUK 42]MBV2152380.1 MFS transporter [Kitasatospora sp. SUK 42]
MPVLAPVAARPRYRWAVLGIATFTQAATCYFVQGIGSLGPALQDGLSLSIGQLGLLLSAAQLMPLIGLLVVGRLLDRYDERWIVGAGALVVAAGLALGSAAPGYGMLLLALLIVGAGYSSAQPGGSKSVASWFDSSQRGLAMGVRQAGLPLGGALAAAVQPVLAARFGWRATLVSGALVALAGAAVFTACYRRPPSPPAASTPPPVPQLRMLREPAMVRIMLSGIALVAAQSGLGILTVLHLHDAGLSAASAALVLVAAQGAGIAGRICLAAWSDRVRSGRYTTVRACLAAVTAGTLALATPLGQHPATACALFVLLGFFGIGWYGPWVAHVAESAPPGRTGSALGLAMTANQIAIVLAPPLLGLLRDATHTFTPPWLLLAALTAAALTTTRP